ncbi:hypothetical protein RFI_32369, partial [Reticulomyxa filosa]
MCRNDLMGRCAECEESNANVESCAIAQGECNHIYHVRCLENTLKSHFRFPLCLQQLSVCCKLLSLHVKKRDLTFCEASKHVAKKKDESQMSVTVCFGTNGTYRSDDIIISKKRHAEEGFFEFKKIKVTTKDRRIIFQDRDIGFETKETLLSSLNLGDGSVKPFVKTVVIDMESKHTIRDVKYEIQQREEIISAKQQVFLNSDEQAKGNELKGKLPLVELTIIVTVRDKCMLILDLFCKGHLLSSRDGGVMDGD